MLKVNVDGKGKYYRQTSRIQRYETKNYRTTSLVTILTGLASMPGYLPSMNVRLLLSFCQKRQKVNHLL